MGWLDDDRAYFSETVIEQSPTAGGISLVYRSCTARYQRNVDFVQQRQIQHRFSYSSY